MTREEYTERFCTHSSPDGCTTLLVVEIIRLEAELERLKQTNAELLGLAQESTPQEEAEPDWHNPDGVESPGEGWRFCVKGEKEDDRCTEWWCVPNNRVGEWSRSSIFTGEALDENYTYRTTKPLPKPLPKP